MNKEHLNQYIKLNHKDETFQELLFKLINDSKLGEVEIYKAANIDRKLFSKIRLDPDYHPSKRNVIALALALKLDSKQSKTLIKRAGYILTSGYHFDLIIRYCLEHGIYNIHEVNEMLEFYNIPIL